MKLSDEHKRAWAAVLPDGDVIHIDLSEDAANGYRNDDEHIVPVLILPDWRPIADAPKDGTPILAWAQDDCSRFDFRYDWRKVSFSADYEGGEPYWRWQVPGFTTQAVFDWWMPLPAPPEGSGAQRKAAQEPQP